MSSIEEQLSSLKSGLKKTKQNPKFEDFKEDIYDSESDLIEKVNSFVQAFSSCQNLIVQTGAGISTSANIPDYRGTNTGIWTKREKGESIQLEERFLERAIPTYSHMSLVEYFNMGKLKYVISSNMDGLHMRSGIPIERLSELHGNIYKEYCELCGRTYFRTFDVVGSSYKRYTGRLCENEDCNGKLRDSIVDHGDLVPPEETRKAEDAVEVADLFLVIGTSLKMYPADKYLRKFISKGNNYPMALVNLQRTAYDDMATIRLHAKCDDFFRMVNEQLGISIPEYSGPLSLSIEDINNLLPSFRIDPDFERIKSEGTPVDGTTKEHVMITY